jgi:hypothetical protein
MLKVHWKSLTSALKLLGCFDSSVSEFEQQANNALSDTTFIKRNFDVFEKFFASLDEKHLQDYEVDENTINICYLMKFLYDMAIDSFDKLVVIFLPFFN